MFVKIIQYHQVICIHTEIRKHIELKVYLINDLK